MAVRNNCTAFKVSRDSPVKRRLRRAYLRILYLRHHVFRKQGFAGEEAIETEVHEYHAKD